MAALLFLLSFASAWYFKVQPSIKLQQIRLQRYIDEQQTDAAAILKDSLLLRKLVLQTESLEEFKQIEEKKYGLFLFAETLSGTQDLFFWNNQKMISPSPDSITVDGNYFMLLPNGWYIIQRKALQLPGMTNTVTAFVLIPVLSQYYIESSYLETQFVHDKDAITKISLSEAPTTYPIKSVDGQTLFYIKRVAHTSLHVSDLLTLSLRLIALFLLLFYLHRMADLISKRSVIVGVAFLALSFLFVRGLLYFSPGIFTFRQFELFDPLIYASNNVNRSLGDLLLNAALLCWVILFAWQHAGPFRHVPKVLRGKRIWVAATAGIFMLILTTFQLANVVRGLVINSKVSFNVNDFFSLDIYTVVGLIVLALLCLSYYFFSRLLFRIILLAFREKPLLLYFIIALIGLAFLTLRTGNGIVLFHLPVLLWLMIYTLLLSQEQFIINSFKATVAGVLFWIFVFSASLAFIILQGNREKEMMVRKAIAEKYDQLTDPSSEKLMSIAITYLNNRYLLSNFDRFHQPAENKRLRDSIISSNFSGYSNGYDTKILVFDSLNRPVNNTDPTSFDEINTVFNLQSRPTTIPDLYYHETSFDKFTYITKREVGDSTRKKGSFFLISTPKQYVTTDALYPELFRRVNRNAAENSPLYSYAVYIDKLLRYSSARYPFQTNLTEEQIPKQEFTQRVNEGNDELWYKAGPKKLVVIARKQNSLIESITLFSYLFCAFLFMVGLLQFFALLIRSANERLGWQVFSRFSIRTQVHSTVIFISILSFLIIGVATISFFINRYKRNNEDRLSLTAGIMVKEMQDVLSDGADTVDYSTVRNLVDEVAAIHNADVNVYDLDGNLELTSDEEVYNKGILSKKMHPLAYYHLSRLREVQRVQEEKVSSLNYLSIYTAVRDRKGLVKKYLNVPYFSSQLDLKQEISNFLVTIINLNAFIFLIAGIIALFITNKITQSFSVIGEKMRAISLNQTNEEIEWNRNDEIGELVTQYNKMVHELEKSAAALARSEREGAWREMARQVAHEIKNPLTPMKLSIQYLQRAINTNQENVKELTTNVAGTLIEQIEHLSKIAADFSQFANIGNRKIELVDLHQVIGSLVDLYNTNPNVTVHWQHVPGSVVMKADRTQMNRLFTNLLTNAVDAVDGQAANIRIAEQLSGNEFTVSIADNGQGIPEEIRSRIFVPNFTTKTSGTGLGLAMSKGIVEQANGEIWFETEEGKGTTFFVRLPVIG